MPTWTNTVTNPDFEVDAAGWLGNTATISRVTTEKYLGTASGQTVTNGAADSGIYWTPPATTGWVVGDPFVGGVRVKAPAGALMKLVASHTGGTGGGAPQVNFTGTGDWQEVIAPGGVVSVSFASAPYIFVAARTTHTPFTFWIDQGTMLKSVGMAPGGPFSGLNPDFPGYDYAWTGTANASTSTLTTYATLESLSPRKVMWFGNEQRMQAVPAPASGMQANNIGYSDSLDYQNGRKGITRTMQTHKEYDLDFPVQEASGASGLDIFSKYASGFYGDLDTYPLFFADPMHYDQNLFPPGWASPGLYARGWSPIVESAPKTYYNLATNPSVEVNTTNYTATAGTSGVAAGTRTSSGPQVSGAWSYRVTWSTATTAVSGGANYIDHPVTVGTTYDFSAYVTTSKIQRVLMTVRWRDAVDASISTVVGTQTVTAANTAVRLSVLSATAPANAVTADIEIAAVTGTSGTNWAIADWIQVDAVMINFSSTTLGTYFDGTTPGAGWQGTAHASYSYMFVSKLVPTTSDTPANSYSLPQKQVTYTVTSAVGAYPAATNEMPYALIPIPPGYTLWMGATGSATGTAYVAVDLYNSPGVNGSPALAASLTLLSSTGATRFNASWSGSQYQYAKVYISRSSTAVSTITLSSMMAQLWPTSVTPSLVGNFIEGKGHRGLKFEGNATVESYVLVDPNRNTPVHYKGLSTRLVEAQDRG